ncbi:hypothetical protein DH2020_000620 [Rehmannia glutinosa]|uniref:RING-type E3 ubiquitin transferase n=1 Tax=Rehmannia glutinosa TaxID=99300 RepID=A0ABR0XXG2_REHGL
MMINYDADEYEWMQQLEQDIFSFVINSSDSDHHDLQHVVSTGDQIDGGSGLDDQHVLEENGYGSVLEAALGRMWNEDDGLRLFRRWNEEIERRGVDSYYYDNMTDDQYDDILRHAIYQDLQYLISNGELGSYWTQHNMGVLVDDVWTLELSRRGLHTDLEVETSDGFCEEIMSKYLKTRSTCADEEQSEIICVVCQDQLYQEKTIRTIATLEYCGHEYHVDCIKQWLRRKNLCPLCKAKALSGDDDDDDVDNTILVEQQIIKKYIIYSKEINCTGKFLSVNI